MRRTSLVIFVAGCALAVSANAQLGRKATPATPAASSTPSSAEQTQKPSPTQTRQAPLSVGLTAHEVQRMIDNSLPAPVDVGKMKAEVTKAVENDLPAPIHVWILYAAVAILAIVAFFGWRRSRSIVSSEGISRMINDRVDLTVKNSAATIRKLIINLANSTGTSMDEVDPEGTKAERIIQIREQITYLEEKQATAVEVRNFAEAGDVEAKLGELRSELDILDPRPRMDVRTTRVARGASSVILVIGLCFAVHSASAAPICYNAETGKTPGSTKVAIAVVNTANTFSCAISGTKVELVDVDLPHALVLTPSVSKKSPLTFDFTPTTEGRLMVKVDGRLLNQLAVRTEAIAFGINDAIDLGGGSSSSGNDATFRAWAKAEFDFYCSASCEGKNSAELFKLATASTKGSTAEAFGILERARRNSTVNLTLGDDRLTKMMAAGISGGIQAYFKANPIPVQTSSDGGVTEQRVQEIAGQTFDSRIAPVATAANGAQQSADAAAMQAGRAIELGKTNIKATKAVLNAASRDKKLDKKSASEWNARLDAELAKLKQ